MSRGILIFRWIPLREICLFSEDAKLLCPWRIGDEDNRTNYGEDRRTGFHWEDGNIYNLICLDLYWTGVCEGNRRNVRVALCSRATGLEREIKDGVWLKAHWRADSFLQRRDYLRDAVEWFVLTEHPQQPKQCEEARKKMMLYLEERATADEVESNL